MPEDNTLMLGLRDLSAELVSLVLQHLPAKYTELLKQIENKIFDDKVSGLVLSAISQTSSKLTDSQLEQVRVHAKTQAGRNFLLSQQGKKLLEQMPGADVAALFVIAYFSVEEKKKLVADCEFNVLFELAKAQPGLMPAFLSNPSFKG